jgi:hypothetical protein
MSNSSKAVEKLKVVSRSAKHQDAATARGGANLTSPEELHQAIAVLAYHYAERRNFEPGHELDDWLDAESALLAERESMKGFPA